MTDSLIDTDERLDTLVGTDLKLIQKIDGTAFAIDTLLLASFVTLPPAGARVADLGSGSGVLSFMLHHRKPSLEIVGIEVLEEFHDLSQRNLQLNPSIKSLSFECLDVRDVPARLLPESFDLVVSNPPYFPKGIGLLPPNPARAAARHEMMGTLTDFLEAAAYLLQYGSKLVMVIHTSRFNEASKTLKELNLGIRRLRFIHPKEGQQAHLALIEAEKFYNGPHEPVPSLTIHQADGGLCEELKEIMTLGLKRPK